MTENGSVTEKETDQESNVDSVLKATWAPHLQGDLLN